MKKKTLNLLSVAVGVLSIFVLLILGFYLLVLLLSCSESSLSKSEIKRLFVIYSEEYSLNLPTKFKKVSTYSNVHQDFFCDLMIVEVDEDYELEYISQCETDRHEKFELRQHFYIISELDDEIEDVSLSLSYDYDWYAYENWNEKGTRVEYLMVVRDNVTNYLYVYNVVTQIPIC